MKSTDKDFKDKVIEACRNSTSMLEASKKLGIKFDTLRKYAKIYGVWNPNSGGTGVPQSAEYYKKRLTRILSGEVFYGGTSWKLKMQLVKYGFLNWVCSKCEIKEWNNQPAPLELDHIDGNKKNNTKENLRLLCSNCHSQTPTFRTKNWK